MHKLPLRLSALLFATAAALLLAGRAAADDQPAAHVSTAASLDRSRCASPSPPYPSSGNGEELSGIVRLKYLIDVSGNVAATQVQRSSGNEQLDASAAAWIKTCHFKPATRSGVPEAMWASQEIGFHRARACATPDPPYPAQSRRDRETGTVAIRYQIADSGRPVNIALAESSGHTLLDNSVIEWFAGCRYDHGDFKDASREAWLTQKFRFDLK